MRLIFDADPVVYAAGFAAESLSWEVVAEDKDGNLREARFDHDKDKGGAKTQANKWLVDNGLTALDWVRVVTPAPLEFALQAVRTTIRGAGNAVAQHRGIAPEALQYSVLLSGPGNFREQLATIAPYKGNRDTSHKPHWYNQIRQYLTDEWAARVIEGREADDEVSILAHQHIQEGDPHGYVVCTIDKDLDQIPGQHYDYKKHVHYDVTPADAKRWFWQQTLSGDATDNIPGCYKIGAATADKLIDQFYSEPAPRCAGGRDGHIWKRIVERYEASKGIPGCPYTHMTAEAAATETARLVYMLEEPGKMWQPPSILK